MSAELRPYQQDTFDKVETGFQTYRKQLVVLPTGGGKTILFSHHAKQRLPGRTLILAHREELIDQAIQKLHFATGIWAQKEKAAHTASLNAPVVVASVQTMARRLHKWPADHFSLVVCDEGHHVLAPIWQRPLKHFDSHALVLGVTATPNRTDKRNLGQYFENIAAEVFLFDLVHQGYLSPIKVKSIPLSLDIRGCGLGDTAKDAERLASALDPYLTPIAEAIADHAAFRKCLAFVPLIATSKKFVAACEKAGLRACHVDGESPDRKEILADFGSGKYDVLSNAMLLTEGYDEPSIDCIIPLRPTKSASLYSQIVGRGTRIAPGKENLLLLDFLWLHEQHNLIHPAHLVAGDTDLADEMQAVMEQGGGSGQPEFDLEGLMSATQIAREKKLRAELEAKAKKKSRLVDALDFCLSVGDAVAAEYEPAMPWEFEKPSPNQLAKLAKNGIDIESVKNRGHAMKIIDLMLARQHANLATPKQVKYLRQFGHPHPDTATFAQASAYLDKAFSRNVQQIAKAA